MGLNCFRFQMRTDRGGECKIVLEFSSLIRADVYRASVDKWRNEWFQLQFYTERFIPYKLQVTDYKQCSFDSAVTSYERNTSFYCLCNNGQVGIACVKVILQ